jgi:phytoene synthase
MTPALRESYAACATLHAAHGRTYYLSTLLLPAWKRPHVHALYGFARWADEVVDDLGSTLSDEQKADRLDALAAEVLTGVGGHPIAPAFADTLRRWDIPAGHVHAFLHAMRQDLTESSYKTFEDLTGYMHGSAAVIGLQMLPVLEPVVPHAVAAPYAVDLGQAFQLTNFLRDVGEDLQRGRLYLPLEDLDTFGVTREQLEAGVVDGRVRRLLAFEIARTRELYRSAAHGVRLLHPTSRPCIETALRLYGGILDEIVGQDYPVLRRRVAVPLRRRVAVAAPALLRSWSARR